MRVALLYLYFIVISSNETSNSSVYYSDLVSSEFPNFQSSTIA